MSGIVKDCKICKEPFTTTSLRAGEWEMKCSKCDNEKKRTHIERNISIKFDTAIFSVENRLEKLEQATEVIPMLVAAEVSNALNDLTGVEMFRSIQKELSESIQKEHEKRNRELKIFKEKLQRQIVTLNNKYLKKQREAKA